MPAIRHIAPFMLGLLLSSAGIADEVSPPEDGSESPPESQSLTNLLAESAYAPRWRLNQPLDKPAVIDAPRPPIAEIEFQQTSSLERVMNARTFSLLTFSSSKQSRLFFGLNEDGLLGFHLRAVSRDNDDEYLELGQMLGTETTESDGDAEQLPPE